MLASLPDLYSMLVTALKANSEVPKMRLLHEERKQEKESLVSTSSKALSVSRSKKVVPKCFHCGKPEHLKKQCRLLPTNRETAKRSKA